MKAWTPEEDERLLAMEAQLLSRSEIAKQLGMTKGMICGRFYRLARERRIMDDWNVEQIAEAVKQTGLAVRVRFSSSRGIQRVDIFSTDPRRSRSLDKELMKRGWDGAGSDIPLPPGVTLDVYRYSGDITAQRERQTRELVKAHLENLTSPEALNASPNKETVAALMEVENGGGDVSEKSTEEVFEAIVTAEETAAPEPEPEPIMDGWTWNKHPDNRFGSAWYYNRAGRPPPGDKNWIWSELALRWVRPVAKEQCKHTSTYVSGGRVFVCQFCSVIVKETWPR